MTLLLSHPTGNANVRAASYGFLQANLLAEFNTCVATFPGDILDYLSGLGPFSELKRRRFDASLQPFTHTFPWWEIGRLVASKVGYSKLTEHQVGPFSVDAVYQHFDKHVSSRLSYLKKHSLQAAYAYEDGAAFTFHKAKRLQIRCYYDLPIGYWRAARRLLEAERERWPEWADTLTGFRDTEEKLMRKDEELSLADQIFVASQFTATTLKDYPGALAPVTVIPYGFPQVIQEKEYKDFSQSRPLKLLFVGSLSQRKGIANLFAAVDSFRTSIQLTIVGQKTGVECKALDKALAKHNWIPSLPHEKILQLMRKHDVLVFPSLFEGFGLVITEAMSQGTPVITTERTVGPDVLTHGQNGWLVEAGSTEALQTMFEQLLQKPDQIALAGQNALETARLRPWSVYGQELANAVAQSLHF